MHTDFKEAHLPATRTLRTDRRYTGHADHECAPSAPYTARAWLQARGRHIRPSDWRVRCRMVGGINQAM